MGADVFFILMGAIMVLAMHAGFAFLEVGTVRKRACLRACVPGARERERLRRAAAR